MSETIQTRLDKLGVEPVIGLETHVTITNTKSKLFCSCPNSYSDSPNIHICPVCTGQMGVLPLPNEGVIEAAIKLSQAIEGELSHILSFDRKHYSYPDLPKGYQITQLENPISKGGAISFFRKDGSIAEIDVNHFHIEEDPAKLTHLNGKTHIDYNRSGRPLFEIVTSPSIHSIEDAILYMEQLQKLVRFLGISEANMEQGQFKSDISISLRKKNDTGLNPRTEIKNMNSFNFALDALKKEISEQLDYRELNKTPKLDQQTKGRNEIDQNLVVLRDKENAADYKFMSEPDIPDIDISYLIEDSSVDLDMIPFLIEKKLFDAGLNYNDVMFFSSDIQRVNVLMKVLSKDSDIARVSKTLINLPSIWYEKESYDINSLIYLISEYHKENIDGGILRACVLELGANPNFNYIDYIKDNVTINADLQEKIDSFINVNNLGSQQSGVIIGKLIKENIVSKNFSRFVLLKHLDQITFANTIRLQKTTQNKKIKKDKIQEYEYNYNALLSSYRSHSHHEINENMVGESISIAGRIQSIRDHGDLIFIDLRCEGEVMQVQVDRSHFENIDKVARRGDESVISVTGEIIRRNQDDENKSIRLGTIELRASSINLLSGAKLTPFEISKSHKVNESTRMTYRYLDLRNPIIADNLIKRHQVIKYLREYFDSKRFIHIDTPILGKPSDEGSREFYVPSRLHPHTFYTLPQAPQQLKQILMGSGIDKYYQVARCFRDEDPKGDRQPEFTQIDLEMAFVGQEEIIKVVSEAVLGIINNIYPHKNLREQIIPHYDYSYVMEHYSSDKPDLRYGLIMSTITDLVRDCGFNVFTNVIRQGGVVKCMKIEGGADFVKKKYLDDTLREFVQKLGGGGLANFTVGGEANFVEEKLGNDVVQNIIQKMEAKDGDILLFAAEDIEVVHNVLSQVRSKIALDHKLYNKDDISLLWVRNFPMFEKTPEGKRKFTHNPFSMPRIEDLEKLLMQSDIESIVAQQYDIVMNGSEIGGGSIRAHLPHILEATYKVMGYNDDEITKSVGHIIEAFKFGFPPHGGLALGLDRILMILQGHNTIREVIPFPKTGDAKDLLMKSPSPLSNDVISQSHIKLS